MLSFQSTPSQRGRPRILPSFSWQNFISIHALAKRATLIDSRQGVQRGISIHALAKRATRGNECFCKQSYISIHALAKRATQFSFQEQCCKLYFNPRPRKEGDTPQQLLQQGQRDFNPRPRKEGDHLLFWLFQQCWISIHALAKRATSPDVPFLLMSFQFQSTPSQRGRLRFAKSLIVSILFQSTPSQRGRHGNCGCVRLKVIISIHALAKRATIMMIFRYQNVLFQSTPSQRGRPPYFWQIDNTSEISIHALAKRATKKVKSIINEQAISIHALAKRATKKLSRS